LLPVVEIAGIVRGFAVTLCPVPFPWNITRLFCALRIEYSVPQPARIFLTLCRRRKTFEGLIVIQYDDPFDVGGKQCCRESLLRCRIAGCVFRRFRLPFFFKRMPTGRKGRRRATRAGSSAAELTIGPAARRGTSYPSRAAANPG